jgi:hypothetical protein
MPVIVEGISVVTRSDAIASKLQDGTKGFLAFVPNQTYCSDEELTRVGFMTPMDTEAFVRRLTSAGLIHLKDGAAIDIVVVDQLTGPLSSCSWIEYGQIAIDSARTQRVAVCRLKGSGSNRVVMPSGWTFEKSLSNSHKFVPTEQVATTMKFLRHENGVDVYLDLVTGKEKYVGRTGA